VPAATAPRILAVRFSSLGDLVLTTPLFRAIRKAHPRAELVLVTRPEYAPLFAQSPRVTEVIGYDPATPLHRLARDLRQREFTHRLDLHGSLRSHALRRLVGGRWGTYPKRRLARAVLIRTKRDVFRDRRHVAERYFDAAARLGVRPDGDPPEVFLHAEAFRRADQFLAQHGLGQHRTLIAAVPGAAHKTKEWPERHWQSLVQMLTAAGMDVVVLGGKKEATLGKHIAAAGGGHAANAAGAFDLQGTAALLKRSRAAAAGDTGVMHLATAVGTPVVTLLGPTVGAFGFLPYAARATVLERQIPCRPCSKMGGPVCPLGHHECLELITPAEVTAALRKLPQ
jgi:lipopolysaccharide heptosyltransferase II